MTGEDLRALMRERRLKSLPVARALDVHPQTIRNLWQKNEVPKLYELAILHYMWVIGLPADAGALKPVRAVKAFVAKPKEIKEDPWSRLK